MAMFSERQSDGCSQNRKTTDGDRSIREEVFEPIAIIGFSLRFPQDATSPEKFWNMLSEARSAMTDVPKDRFNIDAFYHPNVDRLDSVRLNIQSLSSGGP